MAKKGQKRVSGHTTRRTVLQLEPSRYEITLLYLGHDRIAQDPPNYRCEYKLQERRSTIGTKPEKVPNIVSGDYDNGEQKQQADAAATPSAAGGDSRNPPRDSYYRVMVTDNHGLRSTDIGLLGRPDGDNTSMPANYQARNWLRDVKPAVPFRAIVRKLIGDRQVDFNSFEGGTRDLKVVLEIKDPIEEFERPITDPANAKNRRQIFLESFFNKYNRQRQTPDPGDDNAPTTFRGIRQPSTANPPAGVRATTDVLKTMPYRDPPEIDEALAGNQGQNVVQHNQLGNATPHQQMNAKFDLQAVDEGDENIKIGIADLAFCPAPQRGDNYRFLLTLVNDGDQDVREIEENGAPTILVDHAKREIPHPRAYTSGRFIIWRRVNVRLVILINVAAADNGRKLDWTQAARTYEKAFMEMAQPDAGNIHKVTRNAWRTELRNQFDPANTNAGFDNDASFTEAEYAKNLIPTFLHGTVTRNDIRPLILRIIRNTCDTLNLDPKPYVDTVQDRADGLVVAYCKLEVPGITLGGQYLGDRMYWGKDLGSLAKTTTVTAHEIGHAFYLRHAHTNVNRINFRDAALAVTNPLSLANPRRNNQMHDHDQEEAYACLMSYLMSTAADFCAMCRLSLRFFDRVAIQRTGEFRQQIVAGMGPASIARLDPGANQWRVDPAGTRVNIARGSSMDIIAVGPQHDFAVLGRAARKGRVNLTTADSADDPIANLWSATNNKVTLSLAGVTVRVRAGNTAGHRGNVTVRFNKDGVQASLDFNVT